MGEGVCVVLTAEGWSGGLVRGRVGLGCCEREYGDVTEGKCDGSRLRELRWS